MLSFLISSLSFQPHSVILVSFQNSISIGMMLEWRMILGWSWLLSLTKCTAWLWTRNVVIWDGKSFFSGSTQSQAWPFQSSIGTSRGFFHKIFSSSFFSNYAVVVIFCDSIEGVCGGKQLALNQNLTWGGTQIENETNTYRFYSWTRKYEEETNRRILLNVRQEVEWWPWCQILGWSPSAEGASERWRRWWEKNVWPTSGF